MLFFHLIRSQLFNRDPALLKQVAEVTKIYRKKTKGKSYAVRKEFRVLGSALDLVSETLDVAVSYSVYLGTKAFIHL